MKSFLDAKGWQLFLIFIGMGIGAETIIKQAGHDLTVIALTTVLFMALYFGWLWTIASTANSRLDPSLKKSPRWVIIGLAYAALYFSGAMILLPSSGEDPIPGVIVPLHLLAMFAIFYSMGFAARRLVTLERQQPARFSDYRTTFFLFWFFPIGVWIIQPRVNRLLGTRGK